MNDLRPGGSPVSRDAPSRQSSPWPLIAAVVAAGLTVILTLAWWSHALKTEASRVDAAPPVAAPNRP